MITAQQAPEPRPPTGFYLTPLRPTLLYVALRCFTLRCFTLRYVTLRYATLRYATLRYATLRYVTLRYATLRNVTLRYLTEPPNQCKQTGGENGTSGQRHPRPHKRSRHGHGHRYAYLAITGPRGTKGQTQPPALLYAVILLRVSESRSPPPSTTD